MTAKILGIDEADRYAAGVDVPMHILNAGIPYAEATRNEDLIRQMLGIAYRKGMTAGLRVVIEMIDGAERIMEKDK